MKEYNRRTFLKVSAATGAAILVAPVASKLLGPSSPAYAAQTADDTKVFSKYFKVEVKGMYGEVPGVVQLDCGRVNVAVNESNPGGKSGQPSYSYGPRTHDDFTMIIQQAPGNVKLQKWFQAAQQQGGAGSALRRDISVYLLKRDKSTVVRTINCFGCFPTSCNAGDHSTGSDIKTLTMTCKVDRIEVA